MYNIRLTDGNHNWQKQNLTTLFDGRKSYDIYKCSLCGIEGKTTSLVRIALKGSYNEDKVWCCPGAADKNAIPTRIKITKCTAVGTQFENLIPDSEHDVVNPPTGYKNDWSGVWVMGVGEPVKVLSNEYTKIN